MIHKRTFIYSALLLTGVNLLLRLVATVFQIYLSQIIGSEGIGNLQLTLSITSLAIIAGTAGIRTTAMYLSAEELARKSVGKIPYVIHGSLIYCLTASGTICLLLHYFSPFICRHWIRNMDMLPALRTFTAFMPIQCLCAVFSGYFIASGRIGHLTFLEVAEQFISIGISILMILTIGKNHTALICQAVFFGSSMGAVFLLLSFYFLYLKDQYQPTVPHCTVSKRICSTAIPLALGDNLRAGISSVEHLMIPRRLSLYAAIGNPLAAFGMISGMVFPVIMFPTAILYALVELFIPEFARCNAVKQNRQIQYMISRILRCTMLYSFIAGGWIWLMAENLSRWLYPGAAVQRGMRLFSCLIPMLYCDIMTDGITKGLGQQKYCVRFNIISNLLDICLLFFLLPTLGLTGYFMSFMISHGVNFLLSLRHLYRYANVKPNIYFPIFGILACIISCLCALRLQGITAVTFAYFGLFFTLCYLFGMITKEEIIWFCTILKREKSLPNI